VSFAAEEKAGIVLTIGLTIEFIFLGLTVPAEVGDAGAMLIPI